MHRGARSPALQAAPRRAGSGRLAPPREQCPAPDENTPWSEHDHGAGTAHSSFRLPTPSAPSDATVTGLAWVNKGLRPSYPLVNKDRTDRSEAATGSGRIGSKSTPLCRRREWRGAFGATVARSSSVAAVTIAALGRHPRSGTGSGHHGRGLLDDHPTAEALPPTGRRICKGKPVVSCMPAHETAQSPGHKCQFSICLAGFHVDRGKFLPN